MPHHRHQLLSVWIVGYAAGVTVWYALRRLLFDDVWWLAMINTAALALFVPLLPLGAVALLRRRWRLLGLLLIPALLGMQLYGALPTPRSSRAARIHVSHHCDDLQRLVS